MPHHDLLKVITCGHYNEGTKRPSVFGAFDHNNYDNGNDYDDRLTCLDIMGDSDGDDPQLFVDRGERVEKRRLFGDDGDGDNRPYLHIEDSDGDDPPLFRHRGERVEKRCFFKRFGDDVDGNGDGDVGDRPDFHIEDSDKDDVPHAWIGWGELSTEQQEEMEREKWGKHREKIHLRYLVAQRGHVATVPPPRVGNGNALGNAEEGSGDSEKELQDEENNEKSIEIESNQIGEEKKRRCRDRDETDQVYDLVHTYFQIAQNHELRELREQNKDFFDTLLQHAVPMALKVASLANRKDLLGQDNIVIQHFPTAVNFGYQVMAIPEVQQNKGLFDKIFHIGMPLVLTSAQTLIGEKSLRTTTDEGTQNTLFESIFGKLPAVVFDMLSEIIGEDKLKLEEKYTGFFDVTKKVAAIVLNVAGSVASSLADQLSFDFGPNERGFFSTLKKVASHVVSNPDVQGIGRVAMHAGVRIALYSSISDKRTVNETPESVELQVRGFFGSMLQTLIPISISVLQEVIEGRKGVVVPQKRSIFDIVAQRLPSLIQTARIDFAQMSSLGCNTEDEATYLKRFFSTAADLLVADAREEIEASLSVYYPIPVPKKIHPPAPIISLTPAPRNLGPSNLYETLFPDL